MKIIITEEQLSKIVKKNKETYFRTFSGAVQYAREYCENKGYEINEDDWWNEVNMGDGKPKEGQTTRISLGLSKNGKPLRKTLNIQVYNMGLQHENNYELNFYIW